MGWKADVAFDAMSPHPRSGMTTSKRTALRWAIGLAVALLPRQPIQACALAIPPVQPVFRLAEAADVSIFAASLRLPRHHVVMIGIEALDWTDPSPKLWAVLDMAENYRDLQRRRQSVLLLTFDPRGRGPGTLHVLDRAGKGWRPLMSTPFDPARQRVSVGDGDHVEPNEVRRTMRLFALEPITTSWADRREDQRYLMKRAGYDRRWSWVPLPSDKVAPDGLRGDAHGDLWAWDERGYRRIAAGPRRDAFQDKWRLQNICKTMP